MKPNRQVLMELLHESQSLLSEPELLAQTAQPGRAPNRESQRYMRILKNNVARIQRMLNDAESLWTFEDQQLSCPLPFRAFPERSDDVGSHLQRMKKPPTQMPTAF